MVKWIKTLDLNCMKSIFIGWFILINLAGIGVTIAYFLETRH
jgi:hypothetical protein